jgi:hypothetical protein
MRITSIYARVSSEQQREQNTIASQTAGADWFPKGRDLEVPQDWVFEDEGYTAAILEPPGWSACGTSPPKGRSRIEVRWLGCAGLLAGSSEPRVSEPDSADGGWRSSPVTESRHCL